MSTLFCMSLKLPSTFSKRAQLRPAPSFFKIDGDIGAFGLQSRVEIGRKRERRADVRHAHRIQLDSLLDFRAWSDPEPSRPPHNTVSDSTNTVTAAVSLFRQVFEVRWRGRRAGAFLISLGQGFVETDRSSSPYRQPWNV